MTSRNSIHLHSKPKRPASLPRKRTLAVLLHAVLIGGVALSMAGQSSTSWAQAAVAEQKSFNVQAGTLEDALNQFARQAGITLSFDPVLVKGKTAAALKGNFTVEQGLNGLLSGHHLRLVTLKNSTYGLQESQQIPQGDVTLPAVTITASMESATTEGSGSYTTRSMNTATKLALSMRETPQAVTVMTRQRMDDQGLNDINDVVNQTPGVVFYKEAPVRQRYHARGFNIDNLMFDGLTSSISTGSLSTDLILSDLALYDRIEVVRGAAGLTQGTGSPSAAINLVRKRPKQDRQISLTGSVGSWNRYRTEVDVSTPLNEEKTVRGRVVAAYEDADSFQDVVNKKRSVLYGVIEADIGRDTILTIGASSQKEDNRNMWGGLPTAWDGSDLHLPRSTYLGNTWGYWNKKNEAVFAEVDHRLGSGWNLKMAAGGLWSDLDLLGSQVRQMVSTTYRQYTGHYIYEEANKSFDVYANGPFRLMGREHELVVGASYRDSSFKGYGGGVYTDNNMDIFNWNHNAAFPSTINMNSWFSNNREKVKSTYATTRLSIAEPLKLIFGGRLDWFDYEETSTYATNAYKINRHLTKYAGLIYDVDKNHSLYASYTDIFRPQSNLDVTNRVLAPITGKNYEIGAKGEYLNGALNASVALFRIDQENRATAISDQTVCPGYADDVTCYEAAGLVRSKGIDLEVNGMVTPAWQIAAGYTYAKATYIKDENTANIGRLYSTYIPVQTVKMMTSYRLPGAWERWRVGGSVYWQSKMFNDGVRPDGTALHIEQKDYVITDVMVSWQATKNFSLLLNIGNVFDKRYYQGIGGITINTGYNSYGAPRNAMLTAKYAF